MVKKLLVTVSAVLLGLPALASAESAADLGAAREAVAKMEQASVQVTNLVNAAKASNDAIKFSCLNDKATQIKSYVKEGQTGVSRANALFGTARSEAIGAILADAEAVERLRTEATTCVGVAEAEEAAPSEDAVAGADAFDAVDPLSGRNSPIGGSPATSLPSVRAPAPASPTK